MTDGVTDTSSTPITGTSTTDQANQEQIANDFSDMSVEEIMFTVLTAQAKEQKEGIDSFAAEIKANTLKATNVNNLKAAIDKAAKNDGGANSNDIMMTWENPDGTTEQISAAEGMAQLGYTPTEDTSAWEAGANVTTDQATLDADKQKAYDDIDASDLTESQKEVAKQDVDDGGTPAQVAQEMGWDGYAEDSDEEYVEQDPTVMADINQVHSDQHQLDSDKSGANISQDDLTELSANLGNYHDDLDGQNQIDMAKLQKDMDDYQTTLQTLQSSTDSMARLSQKIGGSVGGG